MREKLAAQGLLAQVESERGGSSGGGGGGGGGGMSGRLAYQDSGASAVLKPEQAQNIERLGMGMARLGFGADGSSKVALGCAASAACRR